LTIFSKNSYNNKLGVPISLTNLNLNTNFGVFEIGMDRKGEIDYLSRLISPDIGVITNISYAHAKNFNTLFDIAQAKSEIINNIKVAYVNKNFEKFTALSSFLTLSDIINTIAKQIEHVTAKRLPCIR